MSDASTGQGAAQTAEPTNGTATSDGPRDDAQWLGAFLLAHRGKTFRIDAGPAWGAALASATGALGPSDALVPTDVIDDVVRAVGQASAGAPDGRIPEQHVG